MADWWMKLRPRAMISSDKAMGNVMEILDGQRVSEVYIMDANANALPFDRIILRAGSRLDLVLAIMPGVSTDILLKADIEGEGAELNLSGFYLSSGDDRVNLKFEVNHNVPRCASKQLFNGIASGSAKVDFFGKIVVAHGADKTEAYQTNRNILASKTAKIQTLPQLEIYADDVKCSHGATIGQLNEDEQFYMRSRGIPENEARYLQMISFISPVISTIEDGPVKMDLEARIEEALKTL